MESDDGRDPRPNVDLLGMYERLVGALEQLLVEGKRLNDQAVREWAALGLLDALDLGLALGTSVSEETEQRRDAIRAIVEEIDREPPGGPPHVGEPAGPQDRAGPRRHEPPSGRWRRHPS